MNALLARLSEPSTYAGLAAIFAAIANGKSTGDWGPLFVSAFPAVIAIIRPEAQKVIAAKPELAPLAAAAVHYAPAIVRAVEGEAKP